jgi:hypothetical protein
MAALGVDLVSSLAGVKVITGATGELVWRGLPSGHQHNWRCSRIRYACTVMDNDVLQKMEKCGYTRSLKPWKLFL